MFEFTQTSGSKGQQYSPLNSFHNELSYIQNTLQSQAPLISIKEINNLHQLIAKAAAGEYFLIQTSDCTDSFYERDQDTTYEKLDFIQQLAEFLQRKTGVQVGRIMAQSSYEISANKKDHSHIPDPWQMLQSYNCSASIYRDIQQWNRGLQSEQKIHTSREALLLPYEHALTRLDERTGLYYNLSTHFPLLGKCTINSPQHINYLKKIANPIALKVGPDTSIKNLIKTIDALDPDNLPGRITLIPGLGMQSVHRILPQLIEAMQKTQHTVLWSCDPMDGNTETTSTGRKIRKLGNIVEEIKSSFSIHRKMGSQLNALHLEATYEEVTECVNYELPAGDSLTDLNKNYNSLTPRLNYEQTMHVIQCVAKNYVEY